MTEDQLETPKAVQATPAKVVAAPVAPSPAEIVSPTSTASAAAPAEPTLPAGDFVVIAKNPMEMAQAQATMVLWAQRKLAEVKAEHDELWDNYNVALRSKWKAETLKRHAHKAKQRVDFYEKILAALEAGFCIVPNFAVDIFAIRTTKDRPQRNFATRTDKWGTVPSVADQRSNNPALGHGAYVDSVAETRVNDRVVAAKNPNESDEISTTVWADSFRDVDFPFALAKPDVLTATSRAMAMKIFDEMGISPVRPGRGVRVANGDPMVIGRVILGASPQRGQKIVSFLVTWFVDTADI